MQRGAIFGVVLVASGIGGIIVEVERQQQDKRMMTNGAGFVAPAGAE